MPWWLIRSKEESVAQAISLINATTGSADTGANSLAATAANHTAGNLIVVGVVWSGNFTSSVPTDTAGNTYVSTTFKANNGTTDHVEVFYAKNITGNASNIVTAHFSGSATFRRIMAYQYSGCDTTAPFTAGEGGTAVATGTSITTSTWTTATADEVLVCFMGAAGTGVSYGPASGYTMETTNLATDSNGADKIVAATGTYSGGFTWTNSQTAWCAAASFKMAAGGGGATSRLLAVLGAGK